MVNRRAALDAERAVAELDGAYADRRPTRRIFPASSSTRSDEFRQMRQVTAATKP